MVLKGMDPGTVEQLALSIEAAAGNAHAAYTHARTAATELEWTGEDRDRYITDLESTVADAVQRIVQLAEQFCERARKNVAEQESASS